MPPAVRLVFFSLRYKTGTLGGIYQIATKYMPRIVCPYCSHTRSWKIRREKRKCKRCRREYSPARYPVLGIHATEETWRRVIHVFLRQRAILRLVEETGIGYRTAQRMAHHLRIVMTGERVEVFSGPVEIDETYVGGQRRNQRLHIRTLYPPKRGHGTRKLPIFGMYDRNSQKVFVEVMPKKLDVQHILWRVRAMVAPGATIYTDGFQTYRILPQWGYPHAFVDHNQKEYARGAVHTNNMEGFWGILKRTMGCIGWMRRDRLYLFVGEIVWRFNHRNESREEQSRVLEALVIYH